MLIYSPTKTAECDIRCVYILINILVSLVIKVETVNNYILVLNCYDIQNYSVKLVLNFVLKI